MRVGDWSDPELEVIRETCLRIYLPFWHNKGTRDLHCWEGQQSSISALFSLSLTHRDKIMLLNTQVCFRVPPVCTPCTPTWIACWQCGNNITSLTLSSVKL
jgi:hypothetical protein